jgi:MerR family transcriptional regulator/heat shock protein HspR
MRKKKGYFSISAVAKMFSVHQQTVRLYEKEGLITPKRSEGNTRLFSEEDIERLEEVIHLTHTMGINLAGIKMILKLQKKIKKLQKEINDLFKHARDELETESLELSRAVTQTAQEFSQLAPRTQQPVLVELPESASTSPAVKKRSARKTTKP